MEDFSSKGGLASGWDLVAVGSATVDLFLKIDPSNPHFKFNEETNELSMRLGDKIVLDSADFQAGGSANNVSVGVKRLGFKTALIAEIGNDEFSEEILKNLKREGVNWSLIKRGEGDSSFSIILNFKDDRTIFTKKQEREHDFSFRDLSTKWIYLTSLGEKWETAYQKVYEFVNEKAVNLAFNPGPTQIDKGLGSFSYILPKVDILILNKEEAESLVGQKEIKQSPVPDGTGQSLRSDDLKELLFELRNLGAKTVVITDGENGSYAISDTRDVLSQKALEVSVVSKTGAGDAFSSGFLGAILSGKSIKEAMQWGTKNAASVLSKIGAQTGLLRKSDIS